MNKLYLLVALGLSVKADWGVAEDSNGWYAGDCLDDSDFSDTYGYVDFNCGTSCWNNYSDGGNGGDGEDPCNGEPMCIVGVALCAYYAEEVEVCM